MARRRETDLERGKRRLRDLANSIDIVADDADIVTPAAAARLRRIADEMRAVITDELWASVWD